MEDRATWRINGELFTGTNVEVNARLAELRKQGDVDVELWRGGDLAPNHPAAERVRLHELLAAGQSRFGAAPEGAGPIDERADVTCAAIAEVAVDTLQELALCPACEEKNRALFEAFNRRTVEAKRAHRAATLADAPLQRWPWKNEAVANDIRAEFFNRMPLPEGLTAALERVRTARLALDEHAKGPPNDSRGYSALQLEFEAAVFELMKLWEEMR
jgi:hypothetical protein